MPNDIENNVSVAIGGKEYFYEKYDVDDSALWVWGGDKQTQTGYVVKFYDVYPGNHTVNITYLGDSKYAPNGLERIITVYGVDSRENFTIEFYDDYHIYGETNIFGFLMPRDIKNNVMVLIDANPYNYTVYNVSDLELWVWGGDQKTQQGYVVSFSGLSLGNHTVNITYPGDEKYKQSSLVRNITVHEMVDNDDKEFFTIYYYHDELIYGKTNALGFLMPKDITNNTSVQIDWKNYDYVACDVNSEQWKWGGDAQTQQGYIVKFYDLKPGYHDLFITYPGDDKYAPSARTTILDVQNGTGYKVTSKLTAGDVTAYYNGGKMLIVTLMDELGGPIKDADIQIKLNGRTHKLSTNDLGQVRLSVDNLAPKTYYATLTYAGDDFFSSSTVKAKVTIKKATPKISATKKTFKKSLKTKKYTVTLKANNNALKNAKIYLKIKGKTFTAKTNKYGKATFKITKLTKKGTYRATVTYNGNNCYAKKAVAAKLTLK